jgi:hypothetical protein
LIAATYTEEFLCVVWRNQMTVENKVIEKLKKLMKHQESAAKIGSTKEAEAFAAKISELLLQHKLEAEDINISETETERDKQEPIEKEIYTPKDGKQRRSYWRPYLANVIARAHFCRVLTHAKGNNLTFIGTASDKAFAIYAYEVLAEMAETIAERNYRQKYYEYKQEGREYEMKAYKKNFFFGFIEGIKENYRVQRVQFESNPNALVILNKSEDAIVRYYQRVPRSSATSHATGIGANQHAYSSGKEAGRTAQVNRGIGTNALGQKLIG